MDGITLSHEILDMMEHSPSQPPVLLPLFNAGMAFKSDASEGGRVIRGSKFNTYSAT